jgi:2-dehydropantoate 2-reductase
VSEQPLKRVCVVGAGVIGSLYAGHLARVADVAVLTRRPEQARVLAEQGLRISGKSKRQEQVAATADPSELRDFDLGILATKATDLEDAAARLSGLSPGATLMTVQNGLGAEEIVRRHGDWDLISAVTFMSGVRHSDTHVEYELDTETWLGPYAGTETPYETVQAVEALLLRSRLQAVAFPDLRPAQWSKLIFNATVNTVAALTDLPHVSQFADRDDDTDLGHLVYELVEEGKRVAAAVGVRLHDDPWQMNVVAVHKGKTEAAAGEYAHVPSMLQDVRSHRPTEVDFITGALVREAERVGVPVPLHETMYRLVKAREGSW